MLKRTKIIITLGPSTDDPAILERTLLAGVDLIRVNFSHGAHEEHKKRIDAVRKIAGQHDREIGILADLQGPKIRIARFHNQKVFLKEGSEFTLDAALPTDVGDETQVGIDYKELPRDVNAGDTLLLDDGRIVMKVKNVSETRILCEVEVGGVLSNNKGINRLGGGLSAAALTEKDKNDLRFIATLGVDYVAVSFPRSAQDILEARALLNAAKSQAGIIAKIERAEAVIAIDEIIKASNGIMVARGDLAVEIGEEEVPAVQKLLIQRARSLDKPAITATQMMETMIENTVPTRAEVSDVANAILDGTDAVMLSAETAVGRHPDKVVATMVRICLGTEKHPRTQVSGHRLEQQFTRIDEAIAMAAMYTANHLEIKAIITLTESGTTPLWMSRIRSGIPIFGLSRHAATRGKMTLFRGVYPIDFDITQYGRGKINHGAVAQLLSRNLVHEEDWVILTKGDVAGVHGGTNTMKIIRVDDVK
ncbi:MAG: pyruvate kinase [Gammaproteobacteria bacterium]